MFNPETILIREIKRVRHYVAGRSDLPQQTVDAQADRHAVAGRLDVDVARAQIDGLLEDLVESPNHRRAAGEIAKIFDTLLGGCGRGCRNLASGRARLTDSLRERGRDVVERSNRKLERPAEFDLGGAQHRQIARVGHRETQGAVGAFKRKHGGVAQEARGKARAERPRLHQIIQPQPRQPVDRRHFVGEIVCGNVARFPQLTQWYTSRRPIGASGRIVPARLRRASS